MLIHLCRAALHPIRRTAAETASHQQLLQQRTSSRPHNITRLFSTVCLATFRPNYMNRPHYISRLFSTVCVRTVRPRVDGASHQSHCMRCKFEMCDRRVREYSFPCYLDPLRIDALALRRSFEAAHQNHSVGEHNIHLLQTHRVQDCFQRCLHVLLLPPPRIDRPVGTVLPTCTSGADGASSNAGNSPVDVTCTACQVGEADHSAAPAKFHAHLQTASFLVHLHRGTRKVVVASRYLQRHEGLARRYRRSCCV